ncbi:n-acetylmannosaminyltransferase [hydrocarbon metagenome]|uniref:N-acetylmannosaminyltransferase n=1 Tax=hydrocarbon metagenome TaxID=938273 RepID=A0A0W8E9K7_9ZZZZ
MPDRKKADILGCGIDLLNVDETMERINYLIESGTAEQVITLNAEIAYTARQDRQLQTIINSASLVTPDGIGIVWAGRLMGYEIKDRITGIDLIHKVSEKAVNQGWKIYLLGAAPGMADKAARNLSGLYPGLQIAGSDHGYHRQEDMEEVINCINLVRPDILLVALGAPRQEFWINNYKDRLDVPVCIGVGGSFDVIAGVKKRAPDYFIKLNLEWLYRLLSEPARIKRQAVLPLFVLQVLKSKYLSTK